MALSDFMLKTKVNMALMRDPRVGVFDIGVHAQNGVVTLTGDADQQEECDAAAQIARRVEGVREVRNQMTCGVGKRADTADMVSQRFLDKLDEEWNSLPNQEALTQADYLRWALWMVYKFRIPAPVDGEDLAALESDTIEKAIDRIAAHVGAPKALVGLALLKMAEEANEEGPEEAVPDIENAPLVATPIVEDAA